MEQEELDEMADVQKVLPDYLQDEIKILKKRGLELLRFREVISYAYDSSFHAVCETLAFQLAFNSPCMDLIDDCWSIDGKAWIDSA